MNLTSEGKKELLDRLKFWYACVDTDKIYRRIDEPALNKIITLIEHCPEPRTEEERRKFINKWWPKWKDIGAGKGLTSRYINEMIDELDRGEK